MASYTSDDLRKSLDALDACLTGTGDGTLTKAVEELEDHIGDLHARDDAHAEVDWMQQKQLDAMQQRFDEASRLGVSRPELERLLRKLWAELRDMREPEPEEEPSDLSKAVASLLRTHFTPAQCRRLPLARVQRLSARVEKAFGPKGGQKVTYTRELASRLALCKAITPDEHQRWKDTGRLPDAVDLAKPSERTQAQRDTSIQVQHALASMGVSPLVMQHLLGRMGR